MKKQAKPKTKSRLCAMCKNDCKDMYKYGEKHVKQGCYYLRKEDLVNE